MLGKAESIEREAKELIRVIKKDRLEAARMASTNELRSAQEGGDEKEIARLTKVVDILAKRIAEFHERV